MAREITIPAAGKPFKNNATFCVGSGRLGLALQKEYIDHLKIVQERIHFKYIRGHGLFCDDVGIYRETEEDRKHVAYYNFTYLDRIIDSFLEHDIRPFLELGFMPEKLKSGEQTIFYWKGNTTPPVSYEKWAELVETTLAHLIDRYGAEEVITWPVEVWNEPNIAFWAGTMEEYFKLYEYSAKAVKRVDPRIKVGGPVICGIETEKWLHAFFEHCIENNLPLDFVSRHCYTVGKPVRKGQFIYHEIFSPTYMIEELKETRKIMADYPQIANLPLHITEFNSSYVPVCPVHDTTFQAAYIARILSEAGEYADSYSYWTFSDVFEEYDVPRSAFHGGFGLVALNSIKKPVFHTFEFFANAGKELLYRDENLIVTRDDKRYVIIGWNYHDTRKGEPGPDKEYVLSIPSIGQQAILIKKQVGGNYANPLQTWSNLGKPRTLNKEQRKILMAASEPLQTDVKLFDEKGFYKVKLTIQCNHLYMLEILPVKDFTDTYDGFEPDEFFGLE
ncbi:xylan 1,4-beta-xylosidase [Thermoclostridium stercorarium subsp. leptospartum DSM 9219]|uniref:Xylan 1,4-beta-xylosidase n=1 Tax=Thermoclostridium stercorarium subsp. leptospartum DSM 9219 TaxID=1346611 RepID=A0A1B1YJ80_THEST|nr:glycosyl hydrolase [Thermoclostridium stercorarium]ANX00826.1 xylan 1,4-beta-xylosidase [Thermoclostridium stercorarium subsp. leptospartum DSM 9219]